MKKRVVVTGVGVISSVGIGKDQFWNALLNGQTNVRTIPDQWYQYSGFDCNIWSPLDDFPLNPQQINSIEEKQLDKTSVIALTAAFEALDDAGFIYNQNDKKRNTFTLENIDPYRFGVIMGTGIGGAQSFTSSCSFQILNQAKKKLEEIRSHLTNEEAASAINSLQNTLNIPRRFSPFAVPMIMPNAASANIGIKFGLKGRNYSVNSACASSSAAIGNAFNLIQNGQLDQAVTGGAEYLFDDYGAMFYGFDIVKTLCKPLSDIRQSNRPFDRDRTGFLFSQGGAAVLILETLESAQKRNRPVYAEITGYSENNDGFNIMAMESSGTAIRKMLESLLAEQNIQPEEIDYINCHGTGTLLNDEIETLIIEELFGNKPVLNSTKSITGHSLGASGALEAAAVCFSIRDQQTHLNLNLVNPVRPLNFSIKSGHHTIQKAISQSFGFGGHNCGILFEKINS